MVLMFNNIFLLIKYSEVKKIIEKYSIIILAAAIALSSCSKNYLNKNPNASVSSGEALNSLSALQNALNGTYAQLRSVSLFGRDMPVTGDLMADNTYVEVKNANYYVFQYTYSIIATDPVANDIWTAAYAGILDANNIIDANVAGADAIKAQAYAIRALLYFKLVNVFAKPYTDDSTALGVPIVLHYNPYDLPSRNPVKDVYAQIVSDLQIAYKSAPAYSSSIFISKYAVEGLLARAYLYMGDNTDAKSAAVDVIQNSGFTLVEPANFNSFWANPAAHTDQVEVMFEVDCDANNNNGSNDLGAMYINGAYDEIYASSQLYNLYTPTDVRGSLIIPGVTHSGTPAFLINKFPNTANADKDNLKVIRLAEVYLIAAEASVSSNQSDALKYVDTVAEKRDPAFTGYTDTGDALLNDIIQERRKELAFEGDRFYDLNRLKLPVNRAANAGAISAGPGNINLIIPYPDTRRVFPIPQAEILANPNIANQQNPGYN
jgi:hypothetical protein